MLHLSGTLWGLGSQRGAKLGLSVFLMSCLAHGMHMHSESDILGLKFFSNLYAFSSLFCIATGWVFLAFDALQRPQAVHACPGAWHFCADISVET